MTPAKTAQNEFWKWIAGMLAAVLISGLTGLFTGNYLSATSDDQLRREIRIERSEFIREYVESKVDPRFRQLEQTNAQQLANQEAIQRQLAQLLERKEP